VRLLDGPFKNAMARDAAYLCASIRSPAEWLRKEAGLKPKAEAYGGWEAMTIAGHSLGHYLSPAPSCLPPHGDTRFRDRVNYIVDERKWRHARDGGWLSFDLKVFPDRRVSLVTSYWGSETGPRKFDILVNGTKIASQSLRTTKPGEFFDMTYPIPESLARGKNKITIRFEASPANIAGGFYGVSLDQK
jgi:hypothetical protein